MEDGSINPQLFKNKIIIYGCGNDGKKLFLQLKNLDIKVEFFCDSNRELWGDTLYGIPILSYKELKNYANYNLALAFYQYPQVLDKLPTEMRNNVFADFLFQHKGTRKCILCNQSNCTYDKAHFAPFLINRMFLGKEKKTRLIHCLHCGLYYSDYRPNEEEIDQFYTGYRNREYIEQRKMCEPKYRNWDFLNAEYCQRRKSNIINFINSYIDFTKIKTVLDYGGDQGQYIPESFMYAEKYVYDISGNQTIQGVTLLKDLESVKMIKWDFVQCMHLLEHLSDPISVFKNIVNLLQDHSYLYVEVPYQDYIYRYSNVEINEHINFFRESTMKIIGKMFHLKILKIEIENEMIQVLYQKPDKEEG